jgi:hypothetical protein
MTCLHFSCKCNYFCIRLKKNCSRLHHISPVYYIYITNHVKDVWHFLRWGGGRRTLCANIYSAYWSNDAENNTYSFTHVEHSQYIVLTQQENRCVHCYIVVKCRHHISKVIVTILLKHLKITKKNLLRSFLKNVTQMTRGKCNFCILTFNAVDFF